MALAVVKILKIFEQKSKALRNKHYNRAILFCVGGKYLFIRKALKIETNFFLLEFFFFGFGYVLPRVCLVFLLLVFLSWCNHNPDKTASDRAWEKYFQLIIISSTEINSIDFHIFMNIWRNFLHSFHFSCKCINVWWIEIINFLITNYVYTPMNMNVWKWSCSFIHYL